jgi:transposase
VEAAQAAGRTKGTYLAAQYRRLATRRGKNKAVVAVGHTILVIAYHLLIRERDDEDLGEAHFDQHERAAVQRRLVRRLEALGDAVQLEPRVA